MKKNRSTLISGFVLTLGLVCVAVGIVMDPPDLTSEAQASVSDTSLDSLRTSDQPAVKTRPIESLRVGDRVLAKNPEVSNTERESWGEEPDWSTWKKLSVEMPKEDGSTLHVEIIRPVEWLESQVGFVVAERSEPVCHIGPAEGGRQKYEGGTTSEPNAPASGLGANTLAINEDSPRPDAGSPRRSLVDERHTPVDPRLAPTAHESEDTESLPELPLLPRYSIVGLTVELDLAEMGAVGTGIVTDVTDCPDVKPGEGQVITATFRHPPSTDVLDVSFVDESTWKAEGGRQKAEPNSSFILPPSSFDTIGVTDNHLFWSVDRQEFVPIGEMEIGERVQTYHGETKRIASKLPRPGPPELVYNLEVYGEHVYFVGDQALLAHNMYGEGDVPAADELHALVWNTKDSTGHVAVRTSDDYLSIYPIMGNRLQPRTTTGTIMTRGGSEIQLSNANYQAQFKSLADDLAGVQPDSILIVSRVDSAAVADQIAAVRQNGIYRLHGDLITGSQTRCAVNCVTTAVDSIISGRPDLWSQLGPLKLRHAHPDEVAEVLKNLPSVRAFGG